MARQPDLFTERYPFTPGAKAGGTSQDAADAMVGRSNVLRWRVLGILEIAAHTADEVAAIMGESILAIRPRVSELRRMGLIEDTGFRRANASGHTAIVWSARDE